MPQAEIAFPTPSIGHSLWVTESSYIVYQEIIGGVSYTIAVDGSTGTVFDHGTDASTVIQSAANVANQLFIKSAIYILFSAIVCRNNLSIIGENRDAVILILGANTVANVIEAIGKSNITIKSLTVNPNNSVNPQYGAAGVPDELKQNGISLQNCSYVLVEDVLSEYAGWNGFQAYNACSFITFRYCEVIDPTWHGIQFWNNVTNSRVDQCKVTGVVGLGQGGIILEGASNCIISDNMVDTSNYGIECFGPSYGIPSKVIIIGNRIQHYGQGGIYATEMQYSTISNNIIYDPTSNGPAIYVIAAVSFNVTIMGNIIDTTGHGLYLTDPKDFLIIGNEIRGYNTFGKVGIYMTGTGAKNSGVIEGNVIIDFPTGINIASANCQNTKIIQNYFENCGAIPIVDAGTATVIDGNFGYNPRGNIATPWTNGAGNLSDVAAALDNPVSDALYTVTNSPKLIILTNCAGISAVQIDGVTLTNMTTHDPQIYQLNPGQTLHVVWTVTTPHGEVFGQ
ncbi:right-handed parallel beta-helix repeat-containing protein [Candidatus Bathyarchaeota archaeon]|nr:right-handed parallel beta-helix repeat-containing protein [Candidatus Bathyarchaeota archaeon]